MNRKAKIEKGVFGAAPVIDASLPTIKGVDDAVAVATAIGTIGGGVQRLMCSTAWFFGNMAKVKKVKGYKFDTAWEGYYSTFYADAPLQPEAKRKAKANCVIYARVARLPYDTQSFAGQMFDHEHGSQSQKAAALNKLIEDYGTVAPTAEEFVELLPKAKKPSTGGGATIASRAKALKASLASIGEDFADDIGSNAALEKKYDAAAAAVGLFFDMAETVTKLAKKAAKGEKPTKVPTTKVPAALLKGGKPKGVTVQ
jgi:hypothetical protein